MTSIPSSAASGLSPSPPPPPPAPSAGHAKNLSVSSSTFSAHDTPTASTATSSAVRRASVPSDRVRLDLLLTTGQRAAFDFGQDASIVDVKQELWNSWPQAWPTRPSSPESIRILHLGHILPDSVVLGTPSAASTEATPGPAALRKKGIQEPAVTSAPRNLRAGTSTVMHVLIKGGVAEDEVAKEKTATEKVAKAKKHGAEASGQDEDRDIGSGSCRCVIC